MLVTTLEAAERMQAGGEHDEVDGQVAQHPLLGPMHKLNSTHLFAGLEAALVPLNSNCAAHREQSLRIFTCDWTRLRRS
jgi:hypothetical protein